jgi:NADH:ubiquinone oxidoreductase subunit F (NADH-binding)
VRPTEITDATTSTRERPAPGVGLPRLLRHPTPSLEEHLDAHGPLPGVRPNELIDLVERAGLRGRGGASFPTATKLRAVARGRRTVVVANGCEGEPASAKDATLLVQAPHLVLDGIAVAAAAVGAREAVIATERVRTPVMEVVTHALAARAAAGADRVPVRLVGVPPRYIAGEESALVHYLNGGDAKPTNVPPRPFERGVDGRPTLVQNVETLAHLALIARHGDAWFRSIGSTRQPGSALFTVSGCVMEPGVYEAALGVPFLSLLDGAGGTTEEIGAVLLGGYFGSWVPADALDTLHLDNDSLRAAGAALGCGVVAVLATSTCGVAESARVVAYLAAESAGQCGPCVHGLGSVAAAMDAIARRHDVAQAVASLERWSGMITGRGACRHPDGALRFVKSALHTFAGEIELHARGVCTAANGSPVLPVPSSGALTWR